MVSPPQPGQLALSCLSMACLHNPAVGVALHILPQRGSCKQRTHPLADGSTPRWPAGKTISDGYQLLVDKQGVNDQRYFLSKKWSSRQVSQERETAFGAPCTQPLPRASVSPSSGLQACVHAQLGRAEKGPV